MHFTINALVNIAINGTVETYRNLLAVPSFARWIQNEYNKKIIVSYYITVTITPKKCVIYAININNDKIILHRYDGPALITDDSEIWYKFGKLHRNENDGPAFSYFPLFNSNDLDMFLPKKYFTYKHHYTAKKVWYVNGNIHRTNGPAVISHFYESWYNNDILHKIDGPAIIYNDDEQFWYQNGKLHRTDGPAIITPDYERIYVNGKLKGDFKHQKKEKPLFCSVCVGDNKSKCYYCKLQNINYNSVLCPLCDDIHEYYQKCECYHDIYDDKCYICEWKLIYDDNSEYGWTTTINLLDKDIILYAKHDKHGFMCVTNSYNNTTIDSEYLNLDEGSARVLIERTKMILNLNI